MKSKIFSFIMVFCLFTLLTIDTSDAAEYKGNKSIISMLDSNIENPVGVVTSDDGTVLFSSSETHKIYAHSDGATRIFAGFDVLDENDEPIAGLFDSDAETALFHSPAGMDIDSKGNIYVADAGNHAVRMITADKKVTTIAGDGIFGDQDGEVASARFHEPMDIAVSDDGDIFVADTLNHVIRKISTNGQVTTLTKNPNRLVEVNDNVVVSAGDYQDGKMEDAMFNEPSSLVIDGKGNLIVSDSGNHVIRYIDFEKNEVSTIAGEADASHYNDTTLYLEGGYSDESFKAAKFNTPKGVVLTKDGNLLVVDSGNSHIRYLHLKSESVQSLTTNGDLLYPTYISVMANGDLVVTDTRGNDVKKLILWEKPDGFGDYANGSKKYDDEKLISPSARDAVYQVQRLGIMTGSSNEKYLFSPRSKLTRAQFSKMIVNALDLKLIVDENVFSDVAAEEWYGPYIHTAAAYGIINGYEDETFRPYKSITRQQIAIMIGRANNWSTDVKEKIYKDERFISDEALPYVHALYEKGIMTGYENGTFNPENQVPRETAAVMMANLMK